ncbi:MAG: HpcH/HpaI aldolase/citrate lyase family protein [Gammaproteobacteria bacterium]|nr:HpcH/HpaI aldolase/citrate lyase family protein [Gammaproteobacteria bacterium]
MKLPENGFKRALGEDGVQFGLWLALASPVAAELCACAGFDWLLLDGEHGADDFRSIYAQLQAIEGTGTPAIVRLTDDDPVRIKRYLDMGVQSLLIPMVDTAEQAERLVASVRYPPRGIRGLATSITRASRWTQIEDYARQAEEQICLIVQAETVTAIDNLKAIAAVDGVDSVFVGPSDLSASMGYLGQPGHPDVQAVIAQALRDIAALGKAPGTLAGSPEAIRTHAGNGAKFLGIGSDTALLVSGSRAVLSSASG